MSPRTGRPIIGNEPKNQQIALRVTATTKRKFQECSEITGKSQTNLLEEMVDDLHDRLTKEEQGIAPLAMTAIPSTPRFPSVKYHITVGSLFQEFFT